MESMVGGLIMVRTNFMGRVTCDAKVENALDLALVRMGEVTESKVRGAQVSDALVDTGASTLGLPSSMLRQLGLDKPTSTCRSRNTTGVYEVKLYGLVRLTIHGRDISLDAMEVDDGCPVLIGQIPLEHLQLVVDIANHRLEKSTANGGDWILDMF
jgi:predicted aspartyl protease